MRAKHRQSLKRGLMIVAIGAIAGTIAGAADALWWVFELLSHFRLQFGLVSICAAVALFLIRQWGWAAAASGAFLVNVIAIAPMYIPTQKTDRDGASPTLKILQFNAWHMRNRNPPAFANYLAQSDFDIVIVQEASVEIINHVQRASPHFQIINLAGTSPHGGSVVLLNGAQSKVCVAEVQPTRLDQDALAFRVECEGSPISILVPHITAPGTAQRAAARKRELARLAQWALAHKNEACIVIGDFNCTPWSAGFRDVLADSGLVNSQRGFGYQGTWPRRFPKVLTWVFTIPIDHCLHGPTLVTLNREIGPDLGSDHLPLIVRFGYSKVE